MVDYYRHLYVYKLYNTELFIYYSFDVIQDVDWLKGDDRIEGFEWRGGSKGVTSGIHIWSKPFIRENASGEKVTRKTQNLTFLWKKGPSCNKSKLHVPKSFWSLRFHHILCLVIDFLKF